MDKPDMASEFMKILDEEARELRENINKRLEDKGLNPIEWEDKND